MPNHYQITIEGHLDLDWADWFGSGEVTYDEQENTVVTVTVPDQSALHGLLALIRDLNLTLISILSLPVDKK